jgi:hypothetical protein
MNPKLWIFAGIITEFLLSFGITYIINRWAKKNGVVFEVFQIHEFYMKLGCWIYPIICGIIYWISRGSDIWLWDYLQSIFTVLLFKCLLSSYAYELLFPKEEQDFYGKYGRLVQYLLCVALTIVYMLSNNLTAKIGFAVLAFILFAHNLWLNFSETWGDLLDRDTYNFEDVTNIYFYPILPMAFFIINCF